MKPTNLNIIDCSEYDAYDDNLIVGGGKGKFSTCPEDAVKAHEWVSGNNNAKQLKNIVCINCMHNFTLQVTSFFSSYQEITTFNHPPQLHQMDGG